MHTDQKESLFSTLKPEERNSKDIKIPLSVHVSSVVKSISLVTTCSTRSGYAESTQPSADRFNVHRSTSTNFHWLSPHDGIFLILFKAIKQSNWTRAQWARTPFEHRAMIFRNAADMIAGKYNTIPVTSSSYLFVSSGTYSYLLRSCCCRAKLHAATMLGTGETVWQAEIDSDVETIGRGGYVLFQ